MAKLTEQTLIDQVTVDEWGNVGVRERTDVLRDGEVVASSYHRRVLAHDAPIPSDEDVRVRAIAEAARQG